MRWRGAGSGKAISKIPVIRNNSVNGSDAGIKGIGKRNTSTSGEVRDAHGRLNNLYECIFGDDIGTTLTIGNRQGNIIQASRIVYMGGVLLI